jgi:hypothetical protein
MLTRMQRSERKEREWRAILERWAGSGMSVRAFCEERGLSEPSFYAWRRTLAARDRLAREQFVPVRIAPESAPDSVLEATAIATVENAASALQLLVGEGRRLLIGPGFDGPTLRRLLALLEEGRP